MRQGGGIVLVALALAASPALANLYTLPLQREQDVSWWHYYYGASNGWNLTPGSGSG